MNTLRIALLALMASTCAFSQNPDVTFSGGAPRTAYENVFGYSGANLIYVCTSPSISTTGQRPAISTAISAATNASPVVFTSVGHGFAISARPKITIAGGTVNWTVANATFTATVIDADTFSVVLDSTSVGALTGSLKFTTTAPRSTVAEWSVTVMTYTGANLIWKGWLNGVSSYSQKCSEASSSTLNIQ